MDPCTRPPGTMMCTGARPQLEKWFLVAPLLKQKQQLPIGRQAGWEPGLRQFLANDRNCGIFAKLAKSSPNLFNADLCLLPDTGRSSLSPIEQLPMELFDFILELIPRPCAISLGLCSKSLWNTILVHMKDKLLSTQGCWAGTPLLCGATTMNDFPDTMTQILPKLVDQYEALCTSGHSLANIWVRRSMKNFQELEHKDLAMQWRGAFQALSSETTRTDMLRSLQISLESAISVPKTTAGSKWLLRNLSKNEFVRLEFSHNMASAPAEPDWGHWLQFPKCVYIENQPLLSLDSALVLRTAWSGADGPRSRSTKGAWAGHSFDVVPRTDFAVDPGAWKDVTYEILAEASSQDLLQEPKYGNREPTIRQAMSRDPWGGCLLS